MALTWAIALPSVPALAYYPGAPGGYAYPGWPPYSYAPVAYARPHVNPAWGYPAAPPAASRTPAPRDSRASAQGATAAEPASAAATAKPASKEATGVSPASSAGAKVTLPAGLDGLDEAQRKQRFLSLVAPLVVQENERIRGERDRLLRLFRTLDEAGALEEGERGWLRALARRYRVEGDPLESAAARGRLAAKVGEIPVSLALAQAVNESAWGTSRFAREGQNLFGIWTYDESRGIVPKEREPGRTHLVRRFESLNESVRYYLYTLNSHPAYDRLRQLRAQALREGRAAEGERLAEGLEAYSAKGVEYVRMIQRVIEQNGLGAYDRLALAGAS